MSRTIEHIVETHQIATARRKAGLPIWDGKFDVSDVFHNAELSFEQRRDAITSRLAASAWSRQSRTVEDLADELADVETVEEFGAVWDAIYDEADADRVWIETR